MSLPPTEWRTVKGQDKPKTRVNIDRAMEGQVLCDRMQDLSGFDDLRSQISDAICQLMHTCRMLRDEQGESIDFEDVLESARINFNAEVDEDPDY